jgi:hypothetical protein
MNQTYLKYGLIGALILYCLSVLAGFAGNVLMSLVVIGALGAAVGDKLAKVKLCEAHVYKHLENGELLYCDTKQATHKDYQYIGTSKVDCKNVNRCSLA